MAKSKDKINILFVPYSSSTFIKKDLEILQKHFDVKPVQWRGKRHTKYRSGDFILHDRL